jgi:hypothetical protein
LWHANGGKLEAAVNLQAYTFGQCKQQASWREECMESIMAKTLRKFTPGIPDGSSRITLDGSLGWIWGIDGSGWGCCPLKDFQCRASTIIFCRKWTGG